VSVSLLDSMPGRQKVGTARATMLIVVAACCFGSIATLATLATRAGARIVDVLTWRYLIAALLLMAVNGGVAPLRAHSRRAWWLLLFGGGGQALIATLTLAALRYVSAATMIFLFYSYPAWVAVFSALRGREPLSGQRVVALVLSLAGIATMVGLPGTGDSTSVIGVGLALVAALLYALYIPMIDHLGRDVPPAVTTTFVCVGAAVILGVAAVATGGLAVHEEPIAWAAIGLLAVVCTVVAFLLFLHGLAAIGPVRTAIISTVEPFWGAFLASVVLAQPLSAHTLGGGALVAAAVILLNLPTRRTSPAEA
jgi:drug/metabolite transporter (DMT)-like permease